MRFKPVFHYLGMVLTILGLSMLLPLAFALYYGGGDSLAFVLSLAATISTGQILWRLIPRDKEGISRREALFLVVLIWVVASAFSALPFWLSGAIEHFLDAYFEAVSGLTTTGATVLTSIETQPQGLLLWRSLIQWLGGMGIVMLFVALFPILGIGAAHLFEAEIPGPQVERLTARIRDTAKILWQIYLGLSLLQVLLLLVVGMSPFEALVTTFSTMPTGGFLHLDLSIGAYDNPLIEGIVAFFMMAAGVNFGLYYYLLWRHQPQRFFANVELRAYFAFLFGAILFVGIDLVRSMGLSVGEALRYAGFQSISIMTTTGFTTADFTAWPEFSRAVLLALMLIGASAGSTGGGLKVIRVLVLVKLAYRQILLAFNPRAVIPLNLGGGYPAIGNRHQNCRVCHFVLHYPHRRLPDNECCWTGSNHCSLFSTGYPGECWPRDGAGGAGGELPLYPRCRQAHSDSVHAGGATGAFHFSRSLQSILLEMALIGFTVPVWGLAVEP
ncbi:TrkH family potassium uptake protein [Dehalococcoidia bacterium]|nr:TrkH family potassium uptake protein [Dehalococcoidia bacterium]